MLEREALLFVPVSPRTDADTDSLVTAVVTVTPSNLVRTTPLCFLPPGSCAGALHRPTPLRARASFTMKDGATAPRLGARVASFISVTKREFSLLKLINHHDHDHDTVIMRMMAQSAGSPLCMCYNEEIVLSGWEDGKIRMYSTETG